MLVNAGSENLRIVGITPTDEFGNPRNSFEIGKTAYFNVTIECSDSVPEQILLTVDANDSSFVSLGVAWSNVSAVQGTSISVLSLRIPKSAQIGNATIYADAYTDWLHNGGYPVCTEVSAVFQIVPRVLLGDVSGPTPNVPDGRVNIMDIAAIVSKFGTTPSSPNWNPRMDLNKDGVVNMKDIAIVINNFT